MKNLWIHIFVFAATLSGAVGTVRAAGDAAAGEKVFLKCKACHQLGEGAKDAGAEVRLRRVAELAPEEVIRRQHAWHEHYEMTGPVVNEVRLEDLEWADGFAFGSPTR